MFKRKKDWQLLEDPGSLHLWNIFQLTRDCKCQVNCFQGRYLEITVCNNMLWSSQNRGSLFPESRHQKAGVHSVLDHIKLLAQQP